jgi:site-specific recombinase XerD
MMNQEIQAIDERKEILPINSQYRVGIRRFKNWIGNRSLNEETLREYFREMEMNYSPNTTRLDKVAIRKWIFDNHPGMVDIRFREMIDRVFREIKISTPDLRLRDSKLLSMEEIQELRETLSEKYSLILETLYMTGGRISEILSIRLRDCKMLKTHVEIFVIGKRKKEAVLTITRELFNEIREEFQGKNFLFENLKTGKPLSRQIVHRHLQKAGWEMDRVVHPHQLRHSRVTHLLQDGKPLDGVSKFARHFDPGFTARVYGHNSLSTNEILETGIITKTKRRKKSA